MLAVTKHLLDVRPFLLGRMSWVNHEVQSSETRPKDEGIRMEVGWRVSRCGCGGDLELRETQMPPAGLPLASVRISLTFPDFHLPHQRMDLIDTHLWKTSKITCVKFVSKWLTPDI